MSASAAHVATSSCLEGFGALRGHLQAAKPGLAAQVSDADIEDEFGRFRLWAANIGALSRGHGSLDYRLRDAPVVLEGGLKLLNELQQELHQMCLVLSGARLPYEAQISSRAGHVDDSDAPSLSSDSESSSDSSSDSEDEKLAPSELRRRVSALSNINENLYRLSRSIRAPASHSRSLKALSYKLIDKETGVDVVQQFATVDLAFTKDLFSQLRRHVQDHYGNCPVLDGADVAMIKRLAQGITRRRQQFLYWKHHRKKLGFNAERESLKIPKLAPTVQLRGDETRESVAGPRASLPVVGKAQTESSRPKTTLTETTATLFVAPATVPDGNQSVTSYATTARGLDGSRIEFPKLPKSIKKGKDFECPYCLMICPPHYQMPRAWRAHLLRDLRPYMCTHKHCQQSDELFATKQEWLNHEHTHQKAWQCPEHASAHFSTPEDLKGHLLAETHESLQRMGLEDLLAICETVRPDSRTTCPICFVDTGSSYDLENHLANHLERFAAFALPRDVDSDADEGSHNDSNMSEHAIARSDQSDVSELSHAYDWHKERIEIIGLARNLTDILSNGSSNTISDLKKLYDQMMRITDLPTEIIDTIGFDLQFNAVLKTIPKLLTELLGVVASESGEDNFEELTSELIFQMERLDRIIQEYALDHALDSSHPRLGINTALSDQNPESRLKQSQTDREPAPPRDSSPDSVTNRTDPTLPAHHVSVEGSEDGPRTVQNIWNDTKMVRPSKIRMEPGGILIVNLTSLLTDAYRIQQRLRDFATEDKATPGAIVRLNRIFPDICLGITCIIKTIREGVVDPNAVTSIEVTDTRCRRLFEDASSFLDKFKEGTRPSWGSRTEYRNDIEQLVASAQRALQEINYILEVQAKTRVIRRGREQDDPTSRPPTGGITLPTDSEASGGLSRAGEDGQRPKSSKNSQGTDGILTQGLEEGSEVGHETSDKFVAGQRGSSVPALETHPRMSDSNPQTHDRPIIIDERPLRGILKPGRGKFPEDPSPTREGVAPLGDEMNEGIYLRPSRAEGAPPPGARWTKINRLLVSPEALHEGRERYEARDDFVIVLRVLTKEEIQGYADATARIRAARAAEDEALYERRSRHAELKARAFEQDDSDVDDEGNNSEYERSHKSELARQPRSRRDSKGKDATNMSSTDRLSNDDVESPSSSVGVSLDSNAQKLDKILTKATLRLLFREQLRDTHCEENLNFYLDVGEFLRYCTDALQGTTPSSLSQSPNRSLDVIKGTMASAYGMYNAFLAPGSPCEPSIDHSLRSQLASRMNKTVGRDDSMIESLKEVMKLFKEAQLSVFKRLASDSVPKFMKSAEYEQTLKNYDFDSFPAHPHNENEGTTAYDSDIPFIGPERPMGPGPPEETEPAAPNEDDLVGFYYGYVRPTNRGLTPIQPTLLEGRTDGDVDVVDESRWTRINRRFVSPEALDRAHEKYFVWDPYVIVHRILSREEVDAYTTESTSIRAARAEEGSDRRESYDAAGDTYVRPVVPLSVPRGEGDDQPSRLPPSQQDDHYKEGEVKNGRGWRVPGSWSGPEHGYDKDDEPDYDNERGWNVPDINITKREPRGGGPRADDVLGEPPRPSSAISSIFDDDVILNPHTLPRDSMDNLHRMYSAGPSHQSAETDNKRLPGKNYLIHPPLPASAQSNTPPDLTSSTSFAPSLVYPCTFAFAGCNSSSSSKDYWKRHVDSNHMSFVYWECPLKPCPRPLFHTEDLLERHLTWVHEPPDHEIAALVKKGERPGRRLIEEIRCPAPGCIHGWKGIGKLVWDERMEHVAGHWEAVDRGEEVGGWTEEGGGLLEWAIREGAVTKGKGGRLMCQEALGLWRPEKPLNEKTPTYDDAPGPSSTHDRSPFSGGYFEPNPFTRSSTTKSATDQTTNRLEGNPSVEFVPEHRGEPYDAPLNADFQPRRTESPGYPQISGYTASTLDYDYEDDSTGSRIDPHTPRAPSLPPATDLNANLPSSAAADFAAAAKATANATAMLVHQRDHLGVDPTTQETVQRDEGSKPLDNRDVDAALESSSSTNRWTSGLREARQLTKSVSGLARSLSALSTRDKTSPASHETASGDEGKKPIGSAPGPPPPPPRPSSALSELDAEEYGAFLHVPYSRRQGGSTVPSFAGVEFEEASNMHAVMGSGDVEDETPLDDKSFRRLKRVFSRRNWTEKGKGERRGRDKDKEADGGGGRRSSLFRS